MKLRASILRCLHWLHVPVVLLMALLQRAPAIRVVATASDFVLRSPAGTLLKSAAAALGALGAMQTLAGATTLSPSTPSPTSATVGTPKTVAFSAIGAQSAGESWTVGGSVPPGLTFNGGAASGVVNTPTGVLIMTGTPTTAGTYVLSLRAWEKPNANGESSPTWSYTVVVTGGPANVAPAFTTHPASQTVTAGANVTFTVVATGTPAPTLQWKKNGGAIAGQTGTSLTLNNVQAGDAADYTCVATNTVSSVTSNAATLTVNPANVAPAFTTHPATQTVTAGANVTFSVVATGTPAPTLQWQKNGSAIAGQTGASLTLNDVQAGDAANYTCVATNTVSSVTSNAATLTVNPANVAPVFTTHPATQTVTAGANVTFTVVVTGAPTPTLQWQKNGSALAGQTGASLTLNNVQAGDAASYTCVATNTVSSVTSNAATLTVSAVAVAPAFTTQPVTQTVTVGANVTFSVVATGSPTPTVQWQKNGSAIAGQTGLSLTLNNAQVGDAGSFTCVATNSAGTATSNAATLTVNVPTAVPAFTTSPTTQSANPGANVVFSVVVTGSPTPTLQWQKNGAPIAGQTGVTLTLNNVQSADAGSYACVATNSAGSVTSSTATLTVNATPVPDVAPAFTTQPVSQTVNAGANVSLTVGVTGAPTPTLQWRKNGVALAGQTGATLALNNVQPGDSGSYTCVATNAVTFATSNAATLTVNVAAVAPVFTTQPATQAVNAGTTVTFTVVATGTPMPTLQWLKNGSALAGQTGASLVLNNVQSSDAGSYTCVATNSAGTATSSAAALTINAIPVPNIAPAFTTQPAAQTVNAGANVSFTVVATGSPTPTLQWLKNGSALAGRTGSTLMLSNAQAADAGSYTCVASNAAGSATSSAGVLTVNSVAADSRISNVSVRATLAAAQTLIVGFTMQGGSKMMLIRAVGPGLGAYGVTGAMDDPQLVLFKDATTYVRNDNWGGGSSLSTAFATVGAFPLPANSLDAAIMRSVEGGQSAQVTGPHGGNVLVEAYDAGAVSTAHLSNVSARNFVGTGGDILIAGFMIVGTSPRNLLIRAVGPGLAGFGVPGTLVDPKLSVFDAAGVKIADNDFWDGALASVFVRAGAFPLTPGSKDAAFTINLPPGAYTVQVSGSDGGTGEALVELYELP